MVIERDPVHHELPSMLRISEPATMHTRRLQPFPGAPGGCVVLAIALERHRTADAPALERFHDLAPRKLGLLHVEILFGKFLPLPSVLLQGDYRHFTRWAR